MALLTIEGVVENGRIRLRADVTLPARARAYVVVPDVAAPPRPARVYSPRLVHPEQATDFAKQVSELDADAGRP